MLTISIAGTAGRKDDEKKLNRELYLSCYYTVKKLVLTFGEPIHVVSGGAAYMDHLAVLLFKNKVAEKLTLHLPCKWDGNKLYDSGVFDWKTNPGGTANFLHRKFQEKIQITSFEHLKNAIENPNCETTVSEGFHARNALMAKSDALIALTFGSKNKVKDGGTANCCASYLNNVKKEKRENLSWHIDLNECPLVPHEGIEI